MASGPFLSHNPAVCHIFIETIGSADLPASHGKHIRGRTSAELPQADIHTPRQMSDLFAVLLCFNEVTQPVALWELFRWRRTSCALPGGSIRSESVITSCWMKRCECCQPCQHGEQPGGLQPSAAIAPAQVVALAAVRYPAHAQERLRDELVPQLNGAQLEVYEAVMTAVQNGSPFTAFLDGVGGAGKTFTYNAILDGVRALGHIALPVASSGIAALLLPGGRTAHLRES